MFITPLVASLTVAGFPMTSLLRGTPDEAISKTEDPGQVLDDCVSRPAQLAYSWTPSDDDRSGPDLRHL